MNDGTSGMNVLIIGGGAREHVLATMACRSSAVAHVYCLSPGNAGYSSTENCGITKREKFRPTKEVFSTLEAIANFAFRSAIELTIVGPEGPLADGIVDVFRNKGLSIFGPTAAAAALEADKSVAKIALHEAHLPTASAKVFTNFDKADAYIRQHGAPVVIKCVGLAAGKGVSVCQTTQEALTVAREFMVRKTMGDAGKTILVEDYLLGDSSVKRAEVSVLALVDVLGNVKLLPPAQDYKAAHDLDQGSNTGGMGSISPIPWLSPQDLSDIELKIMRPIISYMAQKGKPFSGLLYVGLMKTAEGFRVIEFNVRFGDPEIVAIYPRLETDLIPIMKTIADGGSIAKQEIKVSSSSAVCVVVVDTEYPSGNKERHISILSLISSLDAEIFIAGAKDTIYGPVSSGGRVYGVVGLGQTIQEARRKVYSEHLHKTPLGHGLRYRKDIGQGYS